MKILISFTRTLVGILFIFSGLVKADDPLGLSYKMQEFFEVWNFHWLDHFTLAFSILMIVFEIVAGVALLLGWRIRLFSWLLLLLIIFFTFLTGYAYLSGKVRECGCFGDCIPLTAGESFTKDLILLILIVFLFGVRNRIKPVLPPSASAAVFTGAAIFSFLFQWYVLVHLPVVDCLPYKAGTNIPDKMKPPPGSVPDSTVITMVYEKDGKRLEFDATHFPTDFNDSYHFVSRYDKLIRKGNAEPAIKDFVLTTGDNTDTTDAVLSAGGYKPVHLYEGGDRLSPGIQQGPERHPHDGQSQTDPGLFYHRRIREHDQLGRTTGTYGPGHRTEVRRHRDQDRCARNPHALPAQSRHHPPEMELCRFP